MPNALALLMLVIWPGVTLYIFRRLPVERALIWATLLAYMFLPPYPAGFDFPLLPPLSKESIPVLSIAAVMVFFMKTRLELLPKSGVAKVLLLTFILSPVATVLTNGEPLIFAETSIRGLYLLDAVALVVIQSFLVVGFLLARQFLQTEAAHRDLLIALTIGGLIYSLPMLVEVRLSPQLNLWIYGYYPSAFEQTIRAGGFRPVVFMSHGIWVAFFGMISAVSALSIWRNNRQGAAGRFLPAACYLFVVTVLCKTWSPLIYATLLVPAILWLSLRAQIRVALVLALLAVFYPLMKGAEIVPNQAIISKVAEINPERANSLQFRLENEERLLTRANEKPVFGWGTWGRNQVRDPYDGQILTITDGLWTITIGMFGWVGFMAQFGLLMVPILLVMYEVFALDHSLIARHDRVMPLQIPAPKMNTQSSTIVQPSVYAGVLALILAANMVDLLPNATLTPLTWIIAGALLGHAEMLALRRREQTKEAMIVPVMEKPKQGTKSDDTPRTVF
jgi:hypothetical protein